MGSGTLKEKARHFPAILRKQALRETTASYGGIRVQQWTGEFWTARQRQASSIHEISYRACFKPQLPRFFVQHLTSADDTVYDPFCGRGTTLIEAALLDRAVVGNDVNPLSRVLCLPRFFVPDLDEVSDRLSAIPFDPSKKADIDVSMFYHPSTEGEIVSLQGYLNKRRDRGQEDDLDRWIRMVATNRLTGHSPGFFSVYTFPPNQAVQPEEQIGINRKRRQWPEYRDVSRLILRKTRRLLSSVSPEQVLSLRRRGRRFRLYHAPADQTRRIRPDTIGLVVTSPPFLDVVQYARDNWLRCWFNGIDAAEIHEKITMSRTIEHWTSTMGRVFAELHRIVRREGWVAFEVGEIRNGMLKLEEHVVPLGVAAGFKCAGVIINAQTFTKTSNLWGVSNNLKGTNSNRIVLFQKP